MMLSNVKYFSTKAGSLDARFCIMALLGLATTVRAEAPADPLPAPQYSFDLTSPSVTAGNVIASDVLQFNFPHPSAALKGTDFGLDPANDDIDALSSDHAGVTEQTAFAIQFSVDRNTIGITRPDEKLAAAGVPYNTFDQALRRQAAGDQFLSTQRFTLLNNTSALLSTTINNILVRNNFDEGGTDFAAYPETHADTILVADTALDRVDAHADLRVDSQQPIESVYFSLSRTSPSIQSLSLPGQSSGANIFVAIEIAEDEQRACCMPDSSCIVLSADNCSSLGGAPSSEPTCSTTICAPVGGSGLPLGACCNPDQSCDDDVDLLVCLKSGGFPTPFTGCDEVVCEDMHGQPGACCELDGGCIEGATASECNGGAFAPGRNCDEIDCTNGGMPIGACCDPFGGCVDDVNFIDCIIAGNFPTPNTTCAEINCFLALSHFPCCHADGSCTENVEFHTCIANGGEPFPGPDCLAAACGEQTPKSNFGACCVPGDSCTNGTSVNQCVNMGGFFVPSQTCASIPCFGEPTGPANCVSCEENARFAVDIVATFDQLGLQQDDDIDALSVFDLNQNHQFDDNDYILFSLTPDSPSLEIIGGASKDGAAADIFVATPSSLPTLFVPALQLGLGASSDNVDALEILVLSNKLESVQAVIQHGIRGDSEFRRKSQYQRSGALKPSKSAPTNKSTK